MQDQQREPRSHIGLHEVPAEEATHSWTMARRSPSFLGFTSGDPRSFPLEGTGTTSVPSYLPGLALPGHDLHRVQFVLGCRFRNRLVDFEYRWCNPSFELSQKRLRVLAVDRPPRLRKLPPLVCRLIASSHNHARSSSFTNLLSSQSSICIRGNLIRSVPFFTLPACAVQATENPNARTASTLSWS
jgi:hypothetical protein